MAWVHWRYFFTWDHNESSLKHFISFCNSYSTNQNMKSKISFKADYSMSHVYFLYTKVKLNAHTLATELYFKPSATFQYLHRTYFHPPHTFRSILKSQFIRIRHTCTDINDYWNHSQQFITFFKSRGFHDTILNKICQDIANTPRRNLFRNIDCTLLNTLLTPNKSNKIPLVTTWHHKLFGFQSILHRRYQEMINEYQHLKCIFSEPPSDEIKTYETGSLIHALPNLLQTLILLLVTVLHVHPNEAKTANSVLLWATQVL